MNKVRGKRLAIVFLVVVALATLAVQAANADREIAKANAKIDRIVSRAVGKIEEADTYRQMVTFARSAEASVFRVLAKLERKIGPVEFEKFYVTVYNDKVGKSVTFDPIHICSCR